MCRQAEENRHYMRFRFKTSVSYTILGNDFRSPREISAEAETMDLSDYGVGICLRDSALKVGFLVVLRIPLSETRTAVPTLAQVKWVKEDTPGVWHAGLWFML